MMKYVRPSEDMRLTVLDGNLCEGKICGVILTIVEGETVVDGYRFEHNGKGVIFPAEQKFYNNDEAFKRGQSIIPNDDWNGVNRLIGSYDLVLWYYKNGKAEPWEWKKELISWEILPDYNAKLLNGWIPSELYYAQEDVYAWYDLIVHKDNGDIEFKKAPLSVLRLNDKQKELFERFKALLEEMNEAKMMILEERDRCEFIMYNNENYDISVDYGEEYALSFPKDLQFTWRNYTYAYRDNDERMSLIKR